MNCVDQYLYVYLISTNTVSILLDKHIVCLYFLYPSNQVGIKQPTGMWPPAATPVAQILSFSLDLNFGLKIHKAHLRI